VNGYRRKTTGPLISRRRVKPTKKPFFKKHERWFSFVGSVVVIGTFIVNDALRDRSKDLADSVWRSQTSFKERAEVQQLAIGAGETEESKLEEVMKHKSTSQFDYISDDWSKSYLILASGVNPLHSRLASSLDNVFSLNQELPYDPVLDNQHWILIESLKYERSFLDHTKELSFAIGYEDTEKITQSKAAIHADLQNLNSECVKFDASFGVKDNLFFTAFPLAINAFTDSVLEKARKVRETAESRATLWRNISYVLYPLGIIIGLLGKLYGAGDSTAE
jgi:hypothetical protein